MLAEIPKATHVFVPISFYTLPARHVVLRVSLNLGIPTYTLLMDDLDCSIKKEKLEKEELMM